MNLVVTKHARRALGLVLIAALAACSGDDERVPVGVPSPADEYCSALHYPISAVDDGCTLPDGTSCAAWALYRGQCGQASSYCETHGGMISTVTANMGDWTAVWAVCTLPSGAQCTEDSFFRSGSCP